MTNELSHAAEAGSDARLIVDSIPGLVALLTVEGDVQFVNRQILEYTGKRWTN
jgi:PAS domain-containing protein